MWYCARRAERVGRFDLDFLPPYSPDLNYIEWVWKLVRRLRLHNRYFGTLYEVAETVEDLFETWGHPDTTLRRLSAFA